ncbi:MAG: DUF2007 domain-containing protein [Hyphomicrobiaceae bacterium]
MHELLRTNNGVLLSFVESLLNEAGITFHIADVNISFAEGSIGAFPRRLLVAEDEHAAARRLLVDAGLADELRPQRPQATD